MIALVILSVVPVPHSYSGQFVSGLSGGPATLPEMFPYRAAVNGHWATTDGGVVDFEIRNSAGTLVFAADQARGGYSFVSDGGLYQFSANSYSTETVQFSGTYSSPLL